MKFRFENGHLIGVIGSYEKRIRIPKGVRSIPSSLFAGNSEIEEIILPASIVNIEDGAFEDCKNLRRVIFSSKSQIEDIPRRCFRRCTNLRQVEIPQSVIYIGELAFNECVKLEAFHLPENLVGIGYGAFWNCCRMKLSVFPYSVDRIEEDAFRNCFALDLNRPELNMRFPGAFVGCLLEENCRIDLSEWELWEHFNNHEFDYGAIIEGSHWVRHLTIRADTIPMGAVQNLPNLKYLTLEYAGYVDDDAFQNLPSLEAVFIKGYVRISYAFDNCPKLRYIVIPGWNGEEKIEVGSGLCDEVYYGNLCLDHYRMDVKRLSASRPILCASLPKQDH